MADVGLDPRQLDPHADFLLRDLGMAVVPSAGEDTSLDDTFSEARQRAGAAQRSLRSASVAAIPSAAYPDPAPVRGGAGPVSWDAYRDVPSSPPRRHRASPIPFASSPPRRDADSPSLEQTFRTVRARLAALRLEAANNDAGRPSGSSPRAAYPTLSLATSLDDLLPGARYAAPAPASAAPARRLLSPPTHPPAAAPPVAGEELPPPPPPQPFGRSIPSDSTLIYGDAATAASAPTPAPAPAPAPARAPAPAPAASAAATMASPRVPFAAPPTSTGAGREPRPGRDRGANMFSSAPLDSVLPRREMVSRVPVPTYHTPPLQPPPNFWDPVDPDQYRRAAQQAPDHFAGASLSEVLAAPDARPRPPRRRSLRPSPRLSGAGDTTPPWAHEPGVGGTADAPPRRVRHPVPSIEDFGGSLGDVLRPPRDATPRERGGSGGGGGGGGVGGGAGRPRPERRREGSPRRRTATSEDMLAAWGGGLGDVLPARHAPAPPGRQRRQQRQQQQQQPRDRAAPRRPQQQRQPRQQRQRQQQGRRQNRRGGGAGAGSGGGGGGGGGGRGRGGRRGQAAPRRRRTSLELAAEYGAVYDDDEMPYEWMLSLEDVLPPANAPGGRGGSGSMLTDAEAGKAALKPIKLKAGTSIEECCICLMDMELSDTLAALPCKHHFHTSCIKQWMTLDLRCPLCRKDVRT